MGGKTSVEEKRNYTKFLTLPLRIKRAVFDRINRIL
jgi:hypothetical protein